MGRIGLSAIRPELWAGTFPSKACLNPLRMSSGFLRDEIITVIYFKMIVDEFFEMLITFEGISNDDGLRENASLNHRF